MRCLTCQGEGVARVATDINPESGLPDGQESECEKCNGSGVTCDRCGAAVAECDVSLMPGPDLCGRCQDKVGTDNPPAEQWS